VGEGFKEAAANPPPKRQGLSRFRGPWVGLIRIVPHGLFTAGEGSGYGVFERCCFLYSKRYALEY